jgi:hypothetical protein
MSKERILLKMIDRDKLGLMINDLLGYAGKLLSEPEPEPFKPDWDNYRQGVADTKLALRDHFAGLAMQGLMSNANMGDSDLHESSADWLKDITESAYEFADAMLKERSKGNE